jgi:hypothetical protein
MGLVGLLKEIRTHKRYYAKLEPTLQGRPYCLSAKYGRAQKHADRFTGR